MPQKSVAQILHIFLLNVLKLYYFFLFVVK